MSSGWTLLEKPLSPVEWHVHLLSLLSRYCCSEASGGAMMSTRSRLSCPLIKFCISFTVKSLWRNRWNTESARIAVILVRLERRESIIYCRSTRAKTHRTVHARCLYVAPVLLLAPTQRVVKRGVYITNRELFFFTSQITHLCSLVTMREV